MSIIRKVASKDAVIGPTREHMDWAGTPSVEWSGQTLKAADCVVIATAHKAFDLDFLASSAGLIIDTRNAMAGVETKAGQVVKA